MAVFDQKESYKTKESKYSKLLNNLLEIRVGDTCLFSRLNSATFDIFTKLGFEKCCEILNKSECKVVIKDSDIENLISELRKIKGDFKQEIDERNLLLLNPVSDNDSSKWNDLKFHGEKVIRAYQKWNQPLSKSVKDSLLNLKNADIIDELIVKLQKDQQQFLNRWRRFAKLVDDKQNLANAWPLYIASAFIRISMGEGKSLYAPLLLKQSQITVVNSQVILETHDDWLLNEKLSFILKRHNILLPTEEERTYNDFMNSASEILSYINVEDKPLSFYSDRFMNLKTDEITNRKVEIMPGVLLGLFYPSGGYLREWMQKIIDNDELDDILSIPANKSIYEDKVYSVLKENYGELVKIQKSSYIQDKALISALNQNTIIWGPPGTGKSQVIVNILANILYGQKSAIVMSQKKSALDVLRKRLGGLSPFVFFFLYEKDFSKDAFYKPLKKFIKLVENAKNIDYRPQQNLISQNQIRAIDVISEFKRQGKYGAIIQAYKNANGDIQKIKRLASVDTNLTYPVDANDENHFIDLTAQLNNVKKDGYIFWWKYPDKFLESVKRAWHIQESLDINDLNLAIMPFKFATIEEMYYLSQAPEILKFNYKYTSDEDFLTDLLSRRILERIETKFSSNEKENFRKYDRFRAAIIAGRRMPHNFVRDHREVILELFSVIVTTPSTVFVNWEKESFDYAIIDEASQMYLEQGLPIMYLAKNKVLAGDPKQMQPSSWFSTRDISDEEDEADNIENAVSVLDYALDKQVYQVMLDQNYRSNSASLMSFSSKNFYDSQLEVINSKKRWDIRPIEVFNVPGRWNRGTNEAEAQKVIELLKHYQHSYKSIIVLTFNIKQKQLIEEILMGNEPKIWNRITVQKTISVRNIENIQGDEADLVIISVVYDETTRMSATYVARANTGKNALNVAISRAKDKMIVVKSVRATDIGHASSEDFFVFREWLSFLDLKEEQQRVYSSVQKSPIYDRNFHSTFEEDVYQKLSDKIKFTDEENYSITTQFPVGSKNVDIAILRNNKDFLLGIEVDGYNYHLGQGVDKYLKDHYREEFIRNKGYEIFRIPEIRWYLSPDKVINQIQQKVNELI